MSLDSNINEALKDAMKARDQVKLRTLRAIKAAFLIAKTAEGASGVITEADELKILQKLFKQRNDSYKIYMEQNRQDLAVIEREEMEVIESFLPRQASDEELEAAIKLIMTEANASSMKDMGRVMGIAGKQLHGKADGERIAALVKKLLS